MIGFTRKPYLLNKIKRILKKSPETLEGLGLKLLIFAIGNATSNIPPEPPTKTIWKKYPILSVLH